MGPLPDITNSIRAGIITSSASVDVEKLGDGERSRSASAVIAATLVCRWEVAASCSLATEVRETLFLIRYAESDFSCSEGKRKGKQQENGKPSLTHQSGVG